MVINITIFLELLVGNKESKAVASIFYQCSDSCKMVRQGSPLLLDL